MKGQISDIFENLLKIVVGVLKKGWAWVWGWGNAKQCKDSYFLFELMWYWDEKAKLITHPKFLKL